MVVQKRVDSLLHKFIQLTPVIAVNVELLVGYLPKIMKYAKNLHNIARNS